MTKEELFIKAKIFEASADEEKDVWLHLLAMTRLLSAITRYLLNKTG